MLRTRRLRPWSLAARHASFGKLGLCFLARGRADFWALAGINEQGYRGRGAALFLEGAEEGPPQMMTRHSLTRQPAAF